MARFQRIRSADRARLHLSSPIQPYLIACAHTQALAPRLPVVPPACGPDPVLDGMGARTAVSSRRCQLEAVLTRCNRRRCLRTVPATIFLLVDRKPPAGS